LLLLVLLLIRLTDILAFTCSSSYSAKDPDILPWSQPVISQGIPHPLPQVIRRLPNLIQVIKAQFGSPLQLLKHLFHW